MKDKTRQKIENFLRENWDDFGNDDRVTNLVAENIYDKVEVLGLEQKVLNYETILQDYPEEIIPSFDVYDDLDIFIDDFDGMGGIAFDGNGQKYVDQIILVKVN